MIFSMKASQECFYLHIDLIYALIFYTLDSNQSRVFYFVSFFCKCPLSFRLIISHEKVDVGYTRLNHFIVRLQSSHI